MKRFSNVLLQFFACLLLSLSAVPRAWALPDAGIEAAPERPSTPQTTDPVANLSPPFWGPRNTVSWSAFFYGSLSFPAFNLEGERALLPRLTAFFALGGWPARLNSSKDGWSGWIEVGARFFVGAEAPRGFFLQGFAFATHSNNVFRIEEVTDSSGTTHSVLYRNQELIFGLGPFLGYTWIPWKRLVLRIGAGATLTRTSFYGQQYLEDVVPGKSTVIRFEYNYWTLLPIVRASVGYAF